ncbi:NAC domain-containing protein 22-like [Hordeum vulgare subsp. vulgare]|uniref:NAC domain-containing protein n=1 Tax=Hordeum vulgare subsp. vulgare TaxID=112509 RepID=A0A8I6YPM6_HORVV|nr:NAC domain-containing protein 22-like [Hordeum vulgare subsp. vulgare]
MDRRGAAAAPSLELPGFRFHPTEEELLEFYLKHHVTSSSKNQQLRAAPFNIIPTVHLYRHDPWDLPGLAAIASEREWYFFVPRDGRKLHAGGGRPSRTTEGGFWKATGSDRAVRCAADPKRLVGLKKTLVYYQGRAPRGTKTDWVMNEYRLPDLGAGEQQDVVLCKVYRKAVSLKELEQRVAMEELARARSTTASHSHSHSHSSAGSPDVSSSASELAHEAAVPVQHQHHGVKKEEAVAVARPPAMRLPQLETARGGGGLEWMQDPFLTQLRSPWMEGLCLSPYYASVLNF